MDLPWSRDNEESIPEYDEVFHAGCHLSSKKFGQVIMLNAQIIVHPKVSV